MAIKSYLAFVEEGNLSEFETAIGRVKECEVLKAQNKPMYILVTDTSSLKEEEALLDSLQQMPCLLGLSLVSAWDDEQLSPSEILK